MLVCFSIEFVFSFFLVISQTRPPETSNMHFMFAPFLYVAAWRVPLTAIQYPKVTGAGSTHSNKSTGRAFTRRSRPGAANADTWGPQVALALQAGGHVPTTACSAHGRPVEARAFKGDINGAGDARTRLHQLPRPEAGSGITTPGMSTERLRRGHAL